jgi:hypothetical protein
MMPYQPKMHTCLDCDAPYYDGCGSATRCEVCELRYRVQMMKLRAYLGAPAD